MDGFYYKKAKKYNYIPRTGVSKADFSYKFENGCGVYPAQELQSYSPEQKKQGDETQYPQESYRQAVVAPDDFGCVGYVGKNERTENGEEMEQCIAAHLKV